MPKKLLPLIAGAAGLLLPFASAAQQAPQPLVVELNKLTPDGDGCRMLWRIDNPGTADLDALRIETVLFDKAGVVSLMTTLAFKGVPAGSERISRFRIGTGCETVGRILINAVSECRPETSCASVTFGSRADIEVTS